MDNTVLYVSGAVASGVGAVAFWMFRSLVSRVDSNERDISAYKLYVAEHYVTQTELTKAVGSLERSIERLIEAVNQNSRETREGIAQIHARIDTKADK